MENWMKAALSGFIDENWTAFRDHLKDMGLVEDDVDTIIDELRPRE